MNSQLLKRFVLPLSLPLVAAFFACSESESGNLAGGPGSITTNGIVAYAGGVPVSGARVSLRHVDYVAPEANEGLLLIDDADAITDSTGRFDLELKEGKFRLTIAHDGVAFSKVVDRDSYAQMDSLGSVNLEATATVTGVADVPEGSKAIWVGVVGTDVLVRSDSNGVFVIPAMPANDSMQLYVMDESYTRELLRQSVYLAPYEQVLYNYKSVVPEDTLNADTLVSNDSAFKVTLLLSDNTPAAYATVALRKVDDVASKLSVCNSMVLADMHADENGQFVMEWPSSGEYRLTVTSGKQSYSAIYAAKNLPTKDSLVLAPSVMYSSNVSLGSEEDFVWVGVHGLDVFVKTDASGAYVLPSLPAGDSLNVYFVRKNELKPYLEWPVKTGRTSKSEKPSVLLYDFENGDSNWYMSVDTLRKGSNFYINGKADSNYQMVNYLKTDSTRDSKVFHSEYSVAYDPYAWALIGTRFNETMNLSTLDSIELYVKGNGHVKVAMENWESYEKGTKASSSWVSMDSVWQRVVFKSSDLCVNSEGKSDCENVWNDVKTGVRQIHIFLTCGDVSCYQDPKRVVDIDDVKLYGVLF